MQHTELDHLVVVADTLDEGVAWCEVLLGATPAAGGSHVLMGTHNRLLALSSTTFPQAYLEIIAIDPAAPSPARPRWFGMDNAAQQARVREAGPQLVAFVARSAMVDMHRWGLINCRLQPGPILQAGRDTPQGRLQWQIVVADDGGVLAGGAVPVLIQWQGPHPVDQLPTSGVQLTAATVRGLPDQAAQVLRLRRLTRAPLPGAALQVQLLTAGGKAVELTTF